MKFGGTFEIITEKVHIMCWVVQKVCNEISSIAYFVRICILRERKRDDKVSIVKNVATRGI